MKRYHDLTETQQKQAVSQALNDLLQEIVEFGNLRFNDELNGDDLQARIDASISKAEAMHTPWFAGEYIMDTCKDDLEALAVPVAEDAWYLEPGEQAMRILHTGLESL